MASPEAATEVEFQPKYSAEDLRDPTKRATALGEYYPSVIDKMSSDEVDGKLEQAIRDGLVQPRMVGDAVQGVDDTFAGKMELESTIPEVQVVLDNLKDRKLQVIGEGTENAINGHMGKLAPGVDKGEEAVILFEQYYRRGDVTLVETKAHVPAKGKPGAQGSVDEVPAEYAWRPANRREAAIKQAFERAVAAAGLGTDEKDKYDNAPTTAGRHRSELDRQAKEEQTKAKAFHEQHQRKLLDEARRNIAEANTQKEGEAKNQTRINTYGLHQETLAKGTKVDNVQPRNVTGYLENGKWIPPTVNAKHELLKDQHVTEQSVVDEAKKEYERHQLEQQYGVDNVDAELERRNKEAKVKATLTEAQKSYDIAKDAWDKMSPATRALIPGVKEPELSNFGPDGKPRVKDMNLAQEEALKVDHEARSQQEIFDRYQKMIDAEPDMAIKKALRLEQDKAVVAEVERQVQLTAELASIKSEAMNIGNDAKFKAGKREPSHDQRVDMLDRQAEEKALARHNALGLDAVPFMEEKNGGLLHFRKNRGPKMVEAYFRVPGVDNLVVLERRRRRSGELVSQTVITTEKPIRKRGNGELPPREVRDVRNEIRVSDRAALVSKAKGRVAKFMGGSIAPPDFVNVGFNSGNKIDGGIDDDITQSVYAKRYMTNIADFEKRQKLSNLKRNSKRRGGFFYWFTGGRL